MDSNQVTNVAPDLQFQDDELRLNSLSLGRSRDSSEELRPASNGSLPEDFYDAGEDIKPEDGDTSPTAMVSAGREGSSSQREIGLIDESEMDGDMPPSPSSSGYAGERGSSCGSSRIGEDLDGGVKVPHDDWDKEKRHLDEFDHSLQTEMQDDESASWRKRRKHFFVLSHSGKPIYSRYGDEHKLAGFSATLQAIISFVENGGDRVKFVRAGRHQGNVDILCKDI